MGGPPSSGPQAFAPSSAPSAPHVRQADHSFAVERCLELYHEGRLEGFEVLKPAAIFGASGLGAAAATPQGSGKPGGASFLDNLVAAGGPCASTPGRSRGDFQVEASPHGDKTQETQDLGDGWLKVGSKYLPATASSGEAPASWPAGESLSVRTEGLHPSSPHLDHDSPAHKELKSLYEELHRRMHHHTAEAEKTAGLAAPPPSATLFPPVASAGSLLPPPPSATPGELYPPPPPGDAFSTPLPWAHRSMRSGQLGAGGSPPPSWPMASSPAAAKSPVDLVDASTVAF